MRCNAFSAVPVICLLISILVSNLILLDLPKAWGRVYLLARFWPKSILLRHFSHGSHGTTFGGNPLACAAALATLKVIEKEDICEKARVRRNYLKTRLNDLSTEWDAIRQVRGKGLMIGVELAFPGAEVVKEMMIRGVLSNCASTNVIRLVPPLNISKEDLDRVVDVLIESIKVVEAKNHG